MINFLEGLNEKEIFAGIRYSILYFYLQDLHAREHFMLYNYVSYSGVILYGRPMNDAIPLKLIIIIIIMKAY